ncbi:30S ribosomal protein S4 [Patescibacteria group bacterium]
MIENPCKKCRRAGEKLFLKGEKCFSPKCVFVKKPYAPGKLQSERKHRSMLTEYGKKLREKQKIRNTYGVREKQFSNYVKVATANIGKKNPAETLYEGLESRLDNVVFRTGFATSRALARQMVAHGHIVVNGKKIKVPSMSVRVGDVIGVREGSKGKKLFTEISGRLTKHSRPKWIQFDDKKLEGTIVTAPKVEKSELSFDLASIIEFYSR